MTRRAPSVWPERPDWDWMAVMFGGSDQMTLDARPELVGARHEGRLAYLASPLHDTAPDADGHLRRIRSSRAMAQAAFWTSVMAGVGVTAVAPVIQAHAMMAADPDALDPFDAGSWAAWCLPILKSCALVVVPPILGWRSSANVWLDVVWALRAERPVLTLTPRCLEVPLVRRPDPYLGTGLDLIDRSDLG